MKNNTKLIVENWRKFLKEGTDDLDQDGMSIDPDVSLDSDLPPPVEDSDLSGEMSSGSMTPKERNEALKALFCRFVDEGGFTEQEADDELEKLQRMIEDKNIDDNELESLAYPQDDTPYQSPKGMENYQE